MNKSDEALRVLADGYVLVDDPGFGTSFAGEVRATYSQLTKIFGEPNSVGDGSKVSTEWILKGPDGVVALYDWKATSLYADDLLTPEQLRASSETRDWHIGARQREYGAKFQLWLMEQIAQQALNEARAIAKIIRWRDSHGC